MGVAGTGGRSERPREPGQPLRRSGRHRQTAIALAWLSTEIRVAVAISFAVMFVAALAGAHAGCFLPDRDAASP